MRKTTLRFLFVAASLSSLASAYSAESTTTPVPRDPKWVARHEGFVAESKNTHAIVLFLGDSITDFWRDPKRGLPVWEKNYASLPALNFGISADRTEHVLWRLDHGEVDAWHPKVVVLMIGTNNTGTERDGSPRNTPAETTAGVRAVVDDLRQRLPDAKILLLAIFPRGVPDCLERRQGAQVNADLSKWDDHKHIYFLDIGAKFLEPDGTISKEIMPDLLHPSQKGYEIWADAIREPLAALLK